MNTAEAHPSGYHNGVGTSQLNKKPFVHRRCLPMATRPHLDMSSPNPSAPGHDARIRTFIIVQALSCKSFGRRVTDLACRSCNISGPCFAVAPFSLVHLAHLRCYSIKSGPDGTTVCRNCVEPMNDSPTLETSELRFPATSRVQLNTLRLPYIISVLTL